MITFDNEKYGKVLIFEPEDVPSKYSSIEEIEIFIKNFIEFTNRQTANIIAFRNIEKGILKLVKNRFGFLDDFYMIDWLFHYKDIGKSSEILDTILSRFDILDIR